MKTTLRRFAAIVLASGFLPFAAAAETTPGAEQFALAQRYENAEGVKRDYTHALELYCGAWRQGHAGAADAIGWIFLNGRGVAHSDAIGAAWLRLAAERGDVHAAQMLRRIGKVETVPASGCKEPEPVEAAGAAVPVIPPVAIVKLVARTAAKYHVDPKLVLAVIQTESAFQPGAVSAKNARGLMQLMPETAERFGVKDVFDPADNIKGGTMYLRWLLAHFRGNTQLAIAAYNAGEGAVDRHSGVPPYPETQQYVQKVRQLYAAAHHPYDMLALR